jgi:hypothetical protein
MHYDGVLISPWTVVFPKFHDHPYHIISPCDSHCLGCSYISQDEFRNLMVVVVYMLVIPVLLLADLYLYRSQVHSILYHLHCFCWRMIWILFVFDLI